MLRYKIVMVEPYGSLEHAVKYLIEKDWIPQGGVCSHKGTLYQAMIKEKPDDPMPDLRTRVRPKAKR